MRHRPILLLVLLMALATGTPAPPITAGDIDIHPRKQVSEQTVDTAAIHISRYGQTGAFNLYDNPQEPGVSCQNRIRSTGESGVSIEVLGPDMYAANAPSTRPRDAMQLVGWYFQVLQVRPDGSHSLVRTSAIEQAYASQIIPMIFGSAIVDDLPIGPHYIVIERLVWYAADETTITGTASFRFEYYVPYLIREDGTSAGAVAAGCFSPIPPHADLDVRAGAPHARLAYTLAFFPLRQPVNVFWDGVKIGTITTDRSGRFSGRFSVPVTAGGKHVIRWVAGSWQVRQTYTVTETMTVAPASAPRGSLLTVSLAGFRAGETVEVRWQRDGEWVTLKRISVAKTGSATVVLRVPRWASEGINALRARGTTSLAKTAITITP